MSKDKGKLRSQEAGVAPGKSARRESPTRGSLPNTASLTDPPNASIHDSNEFSRGQKISLIAVLIVIYCIAGTWGQFDFGDMMGYYTMGARAARAGHLYIAYTPDKVNLIDMIPYQNRYYLQWGPLPTVFHVGAQIAGWNLSDRVACLSAGLLSACLFLEIVLELRRRYFPKLTRAVCGWFFFAFALSTPAALISWRGTVYNESIGIAVVGILGAFLAFLRYQRMPSFGWILLSGAGIAAALLTRITTTLYAIPFFLAFAAVDYFGRRPMRTMISRLLVFSLPILLAGTVQMIYNAERFGSPFDFGLKYKPETTQEDFATFSVVRIPENIGHYLLSLPKVSADFPWLDHTGWQPLVHTTFAEGMSSILLASPFLLLLPLLWRIIRPGSSYPVGVRIAGCLSAGSGLLMFAAMLCFASASRRYVQDFMPMLMVGVFLGAATLSASTLRRWLAPGWAIVAFSALLHAHVAFYESFRSPQPDLNVTRTFIGVAPTIRTLAPGPFLNEEEAKARNDWGTVLLNRRRFREAVEQFQKAHDLLPGSPIIDRNLALAQRMAGR